MLLSRQDQQISGECVIKKEKKEIEERRDFVSRSATGNFSQSIKNVSSLTQVSSKTGRQHLSTCSNNDNVFDSMTGISTQFCFGLNLEQMFNRMVLGGFFSRHLTNQPLVGLTVFLNSNDSKFFSFPFEIDNCKREIFSNETNVKKRVFKPFLGLSRFNPLKEKEDKVKIQILQAVVEIQRKKKTSKNHTPTARNIFLCRFCKTQSLALQKCSGCKRVSYCDKSCQKRHWAVHQPACCRAQLRSEDKTRSMLVEFCKVERKMRAILEKEYMTLRNEFESLKRQREKELHDSNLLKQAHAILINDFDLFRKQTAEEVHFKLSGIEFHKQLVEGKRRWFFCMIGDDCGHHSCKWALVAPEMVKLLNQKKDFVSLASGATYRIDYEKGEEKREQSQNQDQKSPENQKKFPQQTRLFDADLTATASVGRTRALFYGFLATENEKAVLNIFNLDYWKSCAMTNLPVALPVRLQATNEDDCKNLLNLKFSLPPSIKIFFIYNQVLFETFRLKANMEAHWSPSRKNIMFLYHGLQRDSVDSIVCDGLQVHFSKRGAYSRGLYFSTSFHVCWENYATDVENPKLKTVLLCAVNVGEAFVDGDKKNNTAPWNSDMPCIRGKQLLQSVKFHHLGADAYVVPLSHQVYPMAVFQIDK